MRKVKSKPRQLFGCGWGPVYAEFLLVPLDDDKHLDLYNIFIVEDF